MEMQMQRLRQDTASCLADHHSSSQLYEEDEASAAASCVQPAQRMPVLYTHPPTIDYLHTLPLQLPIGNSYTHTPDIFRTFEHTHLHNNAHSHNLSPHNVDDFTPLGTLGRGNMGTVILVLSKHSPSSPFALKITHSLSTKKQRSHVERDILSSLHHPFLQTLHAHFESGRHSLLLLDFCSGGDLNLLRHRQPEKRFSETAARFYAAEVLVALEHLHDKLGIVYRDLKPENILLQGSGHIKLTDFDLSLKIGAGQKVSAHEGEGEGVSLADASETPPIWSLQQQLEAEADAHLQLQLDGQERLHCRGFACLRGYTSRRKVGAQGGFGNQKQRGVCGLKCLCGTIEAGDRRTRKKGTNEWCLSKRNRCVGGKEARKAWTSTKSKVCMPCLPCIKSKEEIKEMERSVCVVGTDEYVAPEVLRGEEHGFSMDWWSFGILLYEMIYGYTPFKGATSEETLYNILQKEPEFPGMKTPAKNLIAQLLVKDPATRLGATGADDVKRHPFFHLLHWESLPHICRPPFIPSPLCLSELEQRYSAKLKAKRDTQNEHKLSNTCKSWLDEVVESLEAAENSSQNSHTSSSAGFISSSADGADRELRRDDDVDAVFSSTEWSSELDVCMNHSAT